MHTARRRVEAPGVHALIVSDVVADAARELERAGVPDPAGDAAALAAHVFGRPLFATAALPPEAHAAFRRMLERRIRREPLEYILERCSFRGLELVVDGRVHVPRDDRTGLLVEVAAELPPQASVHEVGTGSGAVALAVKAERPDLTVSASDISAAAVDVARLNAQRLGIDVAFSVAGGLPAGDFDLVVANLPYSAQEELAGALPPESALYQPHVAVVAGTDALAAIRGLVAELPTGRRVALEHAPEQAATVRALLVEATTLRDAAGDERVTVGRGPRP
jgi:release factor glutamine methyltransferase